MALFKRNETWYIDITTPSGERIKRSAKTKNKKLAQEYHDKLKHEMWQEDKLEKKPTRIFEEMMILFLKDGDQLNAKSMATKKSHVKYWLSIFKGCDISKITSEQIFKNIPTHNTDKNITLSNATKNRYRASIVRAFSLAYKLEWIDSVPFVQKLSEPKVRVRWITKQQANELINNLKNRWMRQVCSFALMTGARMSEILSLKWSDIHLDKGIAVVTSDNSKSGKARSLPLNDDALAIILITPRRPGFVFSRKDDGVRINDIDRRDFDNALKLSNIYDFHFHDLRHTWASWHVQAGTPLFTLKELGGWETLEMVKKYAHLNAEHLSKFSNHVSFTSHFSDRENELCELRVVSA